MTDEARDAAFEEASQGDFANLTARLAAKWAWDHLWPCLDDYDKKLDELHHEFDLCMNRASEYVAELQRKDERIAEYEQALTLRRRIAESELQRIRGILTTALDWSNRSSLDAVDKRFETLKSDVARALKEPADEL